MRIISLLLVLVYVVDAFAQSQWVYGPLRREEKFFNNAPDAKIHWVTASDKGEFIEYTVSADETCRSNLMLIYNAVSNPSRARTNILYFKIPKEDFHQAHFLVDQLNAYEPIEPVSMIHEMKERFTSLHKRNAPEGIAALSDGNFVLFGKKQLSISNRAVQIGAPSGQTFLVSTFGAVLCTLCSLKTSNFSRLSCGHEFCKLCLTRRILYASLYGVDGSFLVCPDKDCNHEFTEKEVKDFCIGVPDLINRFRRLTAKKECTICLEEKLVSAIITLHDDHQFCKDCLLEQLEWAWKDRADSSLLCCPHQGCDYELQESDVRKFSRNDENALRKFHKITLSELLRKNPHMRLCPGVDCDFVYEISQGRLPEQVICPRNQCGKVFCSACQDSHNPTVINCTELLRMKNMSKDQKEKATTEWLDKNTKPCPSCGDRVEKNGGCQYIKCKNCQELFCWICEQSFGKNLTGHQGSLPAHGWH